MKGGTLQYISTYYNRPRRTYYRSYSSRSSEGEAFAVVAIVALYILTFIILSLGAVLSSPVIAIRSEKEQRG